MAMAALARFSWKTLIRQNSLASLVLRRDISAEASPAIPPKVFLVGKLSIFRSKLHRGFRSNIQVRSIIHAANSKLSQPVPRPPRVAIIKHEVPTKGDEDKVNMKGWLKIDDPPLQFDCTIDYPMLKERRLEIPKSFMELNGIKNVSQLRIYGKAGHYFTCDLKRHFERRFVQGRAVGMLFQHLRIRKGNYMIFKLKKDFNFNRDGIFRIHVMKISPKEPF